MAKSRARKSARGGSLPVKARSLAAASPLVEATSVGGACPPVEVTSGGTASPPVKARSAGTAGHPVEAASVGGASPPVEATSVGGVSPQGKATSIGGPTPPDKPGPTGGASPPDKTNLVGAMTLQDKRRICELLAELISVGSNPPQDSSTKKPTWDRGKLAEWYGECAWLSALLSAALGDANVWKSMLTSWDSAKPPDGYIHTDMLGTLRAIRRLVGCP